MSTSDDIIATFYVNSNYGGTEMPMYASHTSIPNLATYDLVMDKSISSLKVSNGYFVYVYTGISYTGYVWIFRGPISIANMSNYSTNGFNFNDQIQSIEAVAVDTDTAGMTLFQGSNQSGLSFYFPAGGPYTLSNYQIGADTTSSVIIYGLASASLSGTDGTQNFSNYSYTGSPYNVNHSDNATSLTVSSLGTD